MRKQIITIILSLLFINIQAQQEYRFIKSSSDSIFYEVNGNGKSVLFLAGGPGGSPESLKPVVDYVSKSNYAILMHQRGTGLSSNNHIDASTITLNQYIDDINSILEKENISQTYIIGHSWGAMLALDYLVKNPTKVKGVILIGASGYSLDSIQRMNNEITQRMTSEEMDSLRIYARQTYSNDPSVQKEAQNKLMAMMLVKQFYNPLLADKILSLGAINTNVGSLLMSDLSKQKWNLKKELEHLNHPVSIINGSYDPLGKNVVISLGDILINSEPHILEDCGHYVWLEKPEELQGIIEEFLSKY